jgi:hypothetical protein
MPFTSSSTEEAPIDSGSEVKADHSKVQQYIGKFNPSLYSFLNFLNFYAPRLKPHVCLLDLCSD